MRSKGGPGVVLAAGIVAAALGGATSLEATGEASPRLRLLYFNDWHGHIEPYTRNERDVGGAARLATLLAQRRVQAATDGADSLFLLAGDVLQGTPMSTVFRGRPDFALLQSLGLDAMTLGNHEFDFGQEVLAQRVGEVSFPVLAANLRRASGELLVEASASLVTARHGMKVAILGLTTEETPDVTLRRNVEGLVFEDPVEIAHRLVPVLAETHDVVVILSHCGAEVDRQLATVAGVAAVIGGHDQRLLDPAPWIGGVPVVQAYEWGELLGELELASGEDGRLRAVANRYLPVDAGLAADPEVERYVAGFRARLGEELQEVLTSAATALEGERAEIRTRETNLGNLVADVIRETTGAEVALINSGSIRASIDQGPVTLEEVMTALPFESELVVVQLSGGQLAAIVERGLSRTVGDDGGFLQLAGLRVVAAEGGVTIDVGAAPLEASRTYAVAMTDFLAGGGDGYHELADLPVRRTGFLLTSAIIAWLRGRESLEAVVDGRLGGASEVRPAA